MSSQEKELKENLAQVEETDAREPLPQVVPILEEVVIEELAVDGICGIY